MVAKKSQQIDSTYVNALLNDIMQAKAERVKLESHIKDIIDDANIGHTDGTCHICNRMVLTKLVKLRRSLR